MMVGPGDEVYEGMIVGIHSRDNDLVVNPLKAKQLTNIRAAGSDENILLTPPVR
jgi:GTP-binding protein